MLAIFRLPFSEICFIFMHLKLKAEIPIMKSILLREKMIFLRISFIRQELFHKEQNLNAMAKTDLFVRTEKIFIILEK